MTDNVSIDLNAVIVSVDNNIPCVLTLHTDQSDGLPFGAFDPASHRTLEIGLRDWVEAKTNLDMGYVEQLYTFGDAGRRGQNQGEEKRRRNVSVGYLALTHNDESRTGRDAHWVNWYRFFPWEDWRGGEPALIGDIRISLETWARSETNKSALKFRLARIKQCFGSGGFAWDEEMVLERFELLYEAGLVQEHWRDEPHSTKDVHTETPPPMLGRHMPYDHRRILATGISRLRGKLKYRPVVYELIPASFTLLELQICVEALTGLSLHKQNFRRYVERSGLIEPTGAMSTRSGGRPAAEFRFKREALLNLPASGIRT